MSFSKQLYYKASSLLPMSWLLKLAPSTTLFPYHHVVSDSHLPHIANLYPYKNVKQFKGDLDSLLKNHSPVSINELLKYIEQHNSLPKQKFLLSFDDGFREVHEVIAPVLSERGIPAVFFINPAFIDNREMFYRSKISLIIESLKNNPENNKAINHCAEILSLPESNFAAVITGLQKCSHQQVSLLERIADELGISFTDYLQNKKPWLTEAELIILQNKGFTIGAHSWDHPYYHLLPLNEQLDQTKKSCDYIRRLFPKQKVTFSFPHSDEKITQQFFRHILNSNPDIDLLFGIQNQKPELNNRMIHRFNAERPGLPMNLQLKGFLMYMFLQKITGRERIRRPS